MTDINEAVDVTTDATDGDSPRGRRDFLGKAAIAAAVTTVAGLSMGKTVSAGVGNAVNMTQGAANTAATVTTSLAGGSTFQVINGSSTGVTGTGAREGSIYGVNSLEDHAGVIGSASGTNGWGVYGRSTGSSGRGVYGLNAGSVGTGVYGEHNNTSTSGTGVRGVSNFGVGVLASGTTFDLQAAGSGRVLLSANGVANPPAGASTVGTIAKDSAGNLWACVASGTPGTWRKLAGPTTAGSLHLLATPKRVYSTRAADEPVAVGPKTPLSAGTRTIDCTAGSSGVPTGATGLVLNVTAIAASANGFLSVSPGASGFSGTSTLNWTANGAVVANGVTVGSGAAATIDVTIGGGGTADFIVDVMGFYA